MFTYVCLYMCVCNIFIHVYIYIQASQVAQLLKKPPVIRETWVQSLGWEDPLEEGMATHSSILAWRIPMDRGAWQAAVHRVTKSRTWLSNQACIHMLVYVSIYSIFEYIFMFIQYIYSIDFKMYVIYMTKSILIQKRYLYSSSYRTMVRFLITAHG